MSGFIWIDRNGERHDLTSPARIEAEVSDVTLEMDRYIDILGDSDRLTRDTARAAIGKLQPRLEQLRADITGWNEHAIGVTRAEAATLFADCLSSGKYPGYADEPQLCHLPGYARKAIDDLTSAEGIAWSAAA